MEEAVLKEEASPGAASAKDELKERKEAALKYIQKKKTWLIYIVMLAIAWFGYYIRTRNIPLLQGKWLPDVDSYAFLRYAEYIAAHGKLMALDTWRYYPLGFPPGSEFGFLSYAIAYLYKILHLFNANFTVTNAAILYPPIAFFIAAIFFFLFVKKLFNYKAAIVSTAFLAVVPAFLYRTMAGVSDKEALAVVFMFATFYFYAAAMKSDKPKSYILNAILAGITTGFLGTIWGGVQLVNVIFGLHAIMSNAFGLFKKEQIYAYTIYVLVALPSMYIAYPAKYGLSSLWASTTTPIMLLGLFIGVILLAMRHPSAAKLKAKVEPVMPLPLFSIIAAIVISAVLITIIGGFDTVFGILKDIFVQSTKQFTGNRWQVTVAENHEPYFLDLIGQFSWKYMLIFFGGMVALFWNSIRHLNLRKTTKYGLAGLCTVFIFLFAMSRYSAGSVLNGENFISHLAYLGSPMIFFGLLIYGYVKLYKNAPNVFEKVKNIENTMLLAFIMSIVLLMAAKSAIRMLFTFAPVTAVLAGYIADEAFEFSKKLKKDAYKILAFIFIAFIVLSTFYGFSKNVLTQASYVGPSFNTQWQNGMAWAKANTPEDAVFAHWWDYGYWVQWGANRATISDGGNAYDGINYFVGRHILTAQNETEALEFMKARGVSYLLAVSEEIGKYPAYSSIGADRNYDRYSWISTFMLQSNQIRETRDETVYLFTGGTPLDDDFIYQGRLFPAGSAGIGAILLPIKNVQVDTGNGTTTMQQLGQPEAIVVYNGQQTNVPLKCVYLNGQEITFEGQEILQGCLRVIPTIDANGQFNPLGAGLYLSPEVYKGLFAKLYLLNQEWPHIKIAYTDENSGMPLALYQGRLIGPMKIWKIDYPEGLQVPPEYYKNEIPDPEVNIVKR